MVGTHGEPAGNPTRVVPRKSCGSVLGSMLDALELQRATRHAREPVGVRDGCAHPKSGNPWGPIVELDGWGPLRRPGAPTRHTKGDEEIPVRGAHGVNHPHHTAPRKSERTRAGSPKSSPGSGSGGRIRTCDLRVMSPTSCQTAPPRDSGEEYDRSPPAVQACGLPSPPRRSRATSAGLSPSVRRRRCATSS